MHGLDKELAEFFGELFAPRLLGEIVTWLGDERAAALLGDERAVVLQLGVRPRDRVGIHHQLA